MAHASARKRIVALALFGILALLLFLNSQSSIPTTSTTTQSASVPTLPENHESTESQQSNEAVSNEPAPSAPLSVIDHPVFSAFDEWTAKYLATSPADRTALEKEGESLATERRTVFKQLIRENPAAAWDNAFSLETAVQLPASIHSQLEKRISAEGDVLTAVGTQLTPEGPRSRKSNGVKIGATYYEAHLYGRRKSQVLAKDVPLHGLAIDNVMAVHENTTRMLSPAEYTPEILAKVAEARCPISGKPVDPKNLAVAAVGSRAAYLCHAGHIVDLTEEENAKENDQIAQEGGNGGGQKPGAPSAGISDGPKTLLYIRLIFPDQQSDPQNEENCYAMLRDMNEFWVGNSHGRNYFIPTVTPPVMMPRTAAWYSANDGGDAMTLRSDALEAAKRAGYDYLAYDLDAIRWTGASGGFGGQAWVGSRGVWMKSSSAGVAAHEFGHNMSLWHANFWNVNPETSIIGAGAHNEYGHSFDTMGAANAGNYYFNSQHQNKLNWLSNDYVAHANTSGTYRIFQLDQTKLENGKTYALKVRKDPSRDYWGEYRRRFTSNNWMNKGLLMHWSPWQLSEGGAHLLDCTPGTTPGKDDAALVIGRTLSDVAAGVHITPISTNPTTPPSLDVVVNLGAFPGNTPPNFSNLTASSTTPAINTSVTFTATATDANGDALAYYWDFGDGLLGGNTSNASNPSLVFTTAGHYNVVCTVTDMKGGTARRSIVITVGAPTNFRISGQVTVAGTPQANVLVNSGNFTTYTDNSGNYTLGRLPNASYTLTALKDGFTFPTQTTSVGPDKSGINFAGTALPVVSLSAFDADITEAGENPGTIRFTRTGDTSAALAVRFMLFKDNATMLTNPITSDADFKTVSPVPSFTSPSYSVTIPAGATTLDWVVTPTDDTTLEGPETLKVVLYPNAAYVGGAQQAAELAIKDSDSTKARVFIAAEDSYGAETGGNTASFRVTRIGATTAALTVNFTDTGSVATSGSDYTALGGSVILNIGEASKLVTVTPLNDSAAEGTESVRVSLSTSPSTYDVDTARNTAFVYLLDDDQNTVSLAVADANASEAGQDYGVFVVSRTGPLTAALTVNYSISGTAFNGNDYFNLPGFVTIPAGQSGAAVTIIPYNDIIGEPNQTVILTVESNVAYQLGTDIAGTVTIADDSDAPYVTLNASDAFAKEGGDNGTFTLFRPKTGGTTTVFYTLGGNAVSASDFTALTGSVTFASGDTTKTVTITPVDDAALEAVEEVTLTLTTDAAYVVNDDERTATVYIHDNEKVEVNLAVSHLFVTETSGPTPFFLSRTSSAGALTVNLLIGGTAINGTDYPAIPLTATFADTQSSIVINIDPNDDAAIEGVETVILTIDNSADYSVGTAKTATMYIADSENAAIQVQFAVAASSGAESAASVNLTVNLSASPTTPVTVEYTLASGSAFIGNDFNFTKGVLTFAAGQTSRTIPLTILEDTQVEPAETIVVRLMNPNNARLGSLAQHTYTINDNDSYGAARIGFAASAASFAENGGTAQIQLALSEVLAANASANFAVTSGSATNGSDYTLANGTITFAAGETLKTLSVPITNDTAGETAETIVITLSAPANAQVAGNTSHTLTIIDDDIPNTLPTISNVTDKNTNEDTPLNGVAFTVGDAETDVALLTVSGTSTNTALVSTANITFGGSGASRTVSFLPTANASGTTTITLTVTDAQLGTATDTFVLTVSAVNDTPTISNISNKTVPANVPSGPHPFTIGDIETAAGSLTVTATSSNTTLVPNANLQLAGTGANRTIRATPALNQLGTTTITVTVSDGSASSNDTFILTVDASATPPTVATAASASPQTVTTDSTNLSVLGADLEGESTLTYTWEAAGPSAVLFDANESNAAKNSQATFAAPGEYSFTVTIEDMGGLSVTSSTTVTVIATLTAINVTPSAPEIPTRTTQAFTAVGADQFGLSMDAGTVTWSVNDGGAINSAGVFTANSTPGLYTVTAAAGSLTGTAMITTVLGPPPAFASAVNAAPNPANVGQTVLFSASAVGSGPFTYAWNFGDGSADGSGANALHPYAAAGTYTATVTATDGDGRSLSASVTVTVNDGGGVSGPDPDADGDGVSDINEVGDGTDPNDPNSFTMSALTVSKMKLSVRFDQVNKDTIQFSGVFPAVPSSFKPLGTAVTIDAGGALATLTLDAKGRAKSATASIGLKLKFTKNKTTKVSSFVGGDVPFKGSMKAGSWSDEWADDGLTGAADAKKAAMSVPVVVRFNGRVYGATVNGVYSAKAGKSGKFSK